MSLASPVLVQTHQWIRELPRGYTLMYGECPPLHQDIARMCFSLPTDENGVKEVSIAKRQQILLDLFDKGTGLAVHFQRKTFLIPG